MEEKATHTLSSQGLMLAKQARLEQQKTGHITVKCPKCKGTPEIITTPRGERTIATCPCGFIKNAEINF